MVRPGLARFLPYLYLFVIAVGILAIPLAVRYKYYEGSLIDWQAYYHIRAADTSSKIDKMSFYEKPFYKTPYHFLLSKTNSIGSKILPFILGLFTLTLIYLIIGRFEIFGERRFYMVLLFILSPIFICLFSLSTPHSLSIALIVFGSYLFIQKNKPLSYLSIVPFLIASFNIFNSLFILVLTLSYAFLKKEKVAQLLITAALMTLVNVYFKNPFMINYEIIDASRLEVLFSEFGSTAGFSVFQAILFFTGFFSIGKSKLKYFYLLSAFFIITFILNPQAAFYGNIFVSLFAGEGFFRIINSRWKSEIIKELMLAVLISGVLFSQISYMKNLSTSPPENGELESLRWLANNSPTNATIFSHYSNAYLIQTIGMRRVLLDPLSSHFDELANISTTLFYSRNLDTTEKILNSYNISYIWINKRMKEKLWKEDDEGLLFLLKNSERFKKVNETSDAEIWRYK